MRCDAPAFYQRGAALILMMFILGMAALAYTVKSMNAASMQLAQDAKTMVALGQAKDALIAWSVTHKSTPGQMPWPDRREVTPPANYDGQSDCSSVSFELLNSLNEPNFLGQIPSITSTTPCLIYSGVGSRFKDSSGNNLWYAVSRNLVRKYSTPATNPIINPGVINVGILKPMPYDGTATTSAYPWLVVKDKRGVVISDRVAVVIIAPEAPLDGQNRSLAAPPSSAYLDNFTVDSVVYSNRDYDQDDEDFVMGDTTASLFNDRLVFITIDELMYALEKRVLQETKNTLNDYYQSKGNYPFAAGFGSVTNQNQCAKGNLRGLLPVTAPLEHVCSCTSASRACSCNFSVVSNIAFTRTSGNFVPTGSAANAPTGACSVAASDRKTCTCTGAGSCKRASGAEQFSCNACGDCSATVAGVNRFGTTGSFSVSTGGCSNTTNQATCSNNTNGTFTLAACDANQEITSLPAVGGQLPAWYLQNEWQKYITYAVSSNCVSGSPCSSTTSPPKITVGINNVGALVATSLATPNGSCDISSYLSATENTNIIVSNGWQDSVYSGTQPKTSTNTDQVLVVSP